jgi:alpha-tubulin suppressor-like RCC1 family protein
MDENKLTISNERSKHKRISSNQMFLPSSQHQRSLKNISERKDLEINKIECGCNYSFFIEKGTGKVFACGYNKLNNLGFLQEHISEEVVETPLANGLTGIENIATDTHSTIMWSNKKKKLFFWGKNNFYKLGVNHQSEFVSGESQMIRLNTSIENKGNLFGLDLKIRK